jgi:hypothetical protein
MSYCWAGSCGLTKIVQQNWTIAIKEFDHEDLLVDQVGGEDIVSLLKGSDGTVFYIAGYLLRPVSKAKSKKNQSVATSKFVLHNECHDVSCDSINLPMRVVDSREIHKGAMMRVSPRFFHFVCLMEALYKVNLNPAVAFAYRENFFCKVDEVVKNSKELALLFADCIHTNCSSNERKQLTEGLFKLILHKYSGLRARDVLRNLKAKILISNVAGDDFSTRTAVLVCIKAAKSTTIKSENIAERYTN